ncbi:MAG: FMN-binding protein [Phycisphaerae bacterium]|nr:FMN-binding protein [Phycisphaerae bacterium]
MKKFIDESWLVLAMGIVFACLLAGAQTAFQDKIKFNEGKAMAEAIAEVVPDLDPETKPELSTLEDQVKGKTVKNDVYKCLKADGSLAGWAIKAEGVGFMDKITLVVGLSPDGSTILGIKVVDDTETPGLGDKIRHEKGHPYPGQYTKKSTDQAFELVKQTPITDNQIQAITGATYSSQFVMDIVNDVLARLVPKLPRESDDSAMIESPPERE